MTSDDIVKLPATKPTARIPYGDAPQHFAELRLPQGDGPFAVVVVIHGGCWIHFATCQYTAHLSSALAAAGLATWNIEYRRAHEDGGGWPGTFRDVGMGVDALREAALRYCLDLARVVVMGHSAGGQLAVWSAARHRVPPGSEIWRADPLPVRGAISLAGIIDMRLYQERGIARCAAGVAQVLGSNGQDYPERFASASPAELLPLGVRQVLVWADDDEIVPQALLSGYERRARELGDEVETITVENATHADLCWSGNPGWARILDATRRLLT